MENSTEVAQKIKNRTTIKSSNSTSEYLFKEMKSLSQRDVCTPMFTAASFTIAKTWKQPQCPPRDKWLKKMWCIYIQWNIIQPYKEGNSASCSNMDEA